MARVSIEWLLGVLMLVPAGFAQDRPDFSGTWTMDPSRSESAHQAVPIGPVTLLIRQTPSELSVETRRTGPRRSAGSTEALTFNLDGTETVNAGSGSVPIKAKARWEGSKLIAETEREVNGATVTTMQVYELGANGREITIHKTLSIQHGYQGTGAERSTGTGTDVFIRKPAKRNRN